MRRYRLCQPGGVQEQIEAGSDEEALEAARDWVEGGDWEVTATTWVHVDVYGVDPRRLVDTVTVKINPEEPPCEAGAPHHWQDDGAPGFGSVVAGHGGGVILRDRCDRCGVRRIVDTWAQDRETGRQGLRSVEYEVAS